MPWRGAFGWNRSTVRDCPADQRARVGGRRTLAPVQFLLYAGHGLIDANVPSVVALRERLRLKLAGRQPPGMSDLYVLVFDDDGRFLGRRDVLVEDGQPVLVPPGVWGTDQRSCADAGMADVGLVLG